jgi:hypothetical protein
MCATGILSWPAPSNDASENVISVTPLDLEPGMSAGSDNASGVRLVS